MLVIRLIASTFVIVNATTKSVCASATDRSGTASAITSGFVFCAFPRSLIVSPPSTVLLGPGAPRGVAGRSVGVAVELVGRLRRATDVGRRQGSVGRLRAWRPRARASTCERAHDHATPTPELRNQPGRGRAQGCSAAPQRGRAPTRERAADPGQRPLWPLRQRSACATRKFRRRVHAAALHRNLHSSVDEVDAMGWKWANFGLVDFAAFYFHSITRRLRRRIPGRCAASCRRTPRPPRCRRRKRG